MDGNSNSNVAPCYKQVPQKYREVKPDQSIFLPNDLYRTSDVSYLTPFIPTNHKVRQDPDVTLISVNLITVSACLFYIL